MGYVTPPTSPPLSPLIFFMSIDTVYVPTLIQGKYKKSVAPTQFYYIFGYNLAPILKARWSSLCNSSTLDFQSRIFIDFPLLTDTFKAYIRK